MKTIVEYKTIPHDSQQKMTEMCVSITIYLLIMLSVVNRMQFQSTEMDLNKKNQTSQNEYEL